MNELRPFLYYLGLIPTILFGLRFIIQWIQSERIKESHVRPSFWKISLSANLLFCLHGLVQLQFPLALIQGTNAVISWRNLNLMRRQPIRFSMTCTLMALVPLVLTTLFILQGFEWMRPPTLPWSGSHAPRASLTWHLIGLVGMLLFASRFWVQWWLAEKHKKSFLGKSFWWMSLAGASLSLVYFIRLSDLVNILGYSIGIIPYARNLVLLKKKPVSKPSNTLFIFAGEHSGDLLGGKLINALKKTQSKLNLMGVGGPTMRKAGFHCTSQMESFQVMGIIDVIKAAPRLISEFRTIKREILITQPKGVVFIDYPEFNMLMAKALRKGGYKGKLIHYVSPSVWAWRKQRIKTLAKSLDRLLTILPFEKACYARTSLPVSYVGHPLVSTIPTPTTPRKAILALFPGSRRGEIERNLPIQWKVAQHFAKEYEIVISVAQPQLRELVLSLTDTKATLREDNYSLMEEAKLALATSGTVVLELALHEVATVVTYKLSRLNYYLGRYLFRIILPHYTLPNIISPTELFPEFIHRNLDEHEIIEAVKKQIATHDQVQKGCRIMRNLLHEENDASQEAAKAINYELSLS